MISLERLAPVIVTDDDGAAAPFCAVNDNDVVLALSDGVPGVGVGSLASVIVPVQLISMRVDPLCTATYPLYVPGDFEVSRLIVIVPPVRLFQPDVATLNADELLL